MKRYLHSVTSPQLERGRFGHCHVARRLAPRNYIGFTLLELIVVLSLIALITAAVVPVYTSSIGSLQARNARDDFSALVVFTQELAVRQSREFRVMIGRKDRAYWVEYLADTDGEEKIYEPVVEPWGAEQMLPEYMEFGRVKARQDRGAGGYYIGCYPSGGCDIAEVEVKDTRERARSFTVKTTGVAGKVEIKE